ncbi:unnamed protein product [Boreogadus saida]
MKVLTQETWTEPERSKDLTWEEIVLVHRGEGVKVETRSQTKYYTAVIRSSAACHASFDVSIKKTHCPQDTSVPTKGDPAVNALGDITAG